MSEENTPDKTKYPLENFNFVLRVEGVYELPCKSVHSFKKENEYEYIQEGGLNDYVHMRRKPISKPFTFTVERYVGVDALDFLTNGAELILPVILVVSRNCNDFTKFKRAYVFTGCTVVSKEYSELNSEKSGLHTELITIAYREMVVFTLPTDISVGQWTKDNGMRFSRDPNTGVTFDEDSPNPNPRRKYPAQRSAAPMVDKGKPEHRLWPKNESAITYDDLVAELAKEKEKEKEQGDSDGEDVEEVKIDPNPKRKYPAQRSAAPMVDTGKPEHRLWPKNESAITYDDLVAELAKEKEKEKEQGDSDGEDVEEVKIDPNPRRKYPAHRSAAPSVDTGKPVQRLWPKANSANILSGTGAPQKRTWPLTSSANKLEK